MLLLTAVAYLNILARLSPGNADENDERFVLGCAEYVTRDTVLRTCQFPAYKMSSVSRYRPRHFHSQFLSGLCNLLSVIISE